MKKIILFGFAFLAIVIVTVFNLSFKEENNKLSSVLMKNVEALAQENNNGYANVSCITTEVWDEEKYRLVIITTVICENSGTKSCVC
jgi:hypothetical protein